MRKELKTSIQIMAKPSAVWSVLMDFESYPHWNPFIKSIKGNAEKDTFIEARIEPPDAKGMIFKPKVLNCEDNKSFRWLGHFFIKGLFDGEHHFELIDNNDGSTTFVHSEKFSGILIPLFSKMLDNNTKRGFEMMNEALKKRVEQGKMTI